MSDKITITTERDGRIIVFEGSGTLTLTERAGGWVETRPMSMEIEWDGDYTIREVDRQSDTLEELAAAWEAAEEADEGNPIREGDVLIEHFGPDAYHVYLAEGNYSHLPYAIRVLSRAPREPWQDLADILLEDGLAYEEDIEGIVKRLYERGVRVTGGDES